MKRFFSLCFLLIFSSAQLLIPFVFAAEEPQLKSFEIVAPTEVNINEGFDITITALGEDGKKLTKYE
jgi:hypothetical protein